MFVKVASFHWQGLAGPALAIVGLALLLAAGSIFVFLGLNRCGERRGSGTGEIMKLKRCVVFGVIFIGIGLAAFAVLGGGQVLSEKYEFIAPAKTEVGSIYYQPLAEELNIALSQMIRKGGARVMKEPDRIDITRNVHVETPFVFIGGSGWVLEFTASGTEALGEHSRILVGVLELNEAGTTLAAPFSIYDLAPEAKTFQIPIRLAAGKIAAVRIEYLNALGLDRKPARVVSIMEVAFKKQ